MFPILGTVKLLLRKRLLRYFLVSTITVAHDGVQAYLVIKPTLTTTNSYDDNPRLRTEEISNALLFTKNEALFASTYVRPTYEVGITPRFRVSRYTEETDLNSEEYYVSTFANKLFERHRVGVGFDYKRQASFTTELDDSGLFNINLFRTTLDGRFDWTYFASERVTVQFNGYVTDVGFDEDPRSRFIDYLVYGTGASINYRFSESTSFWAVFDRSNFKTPQLGSETESYSFQLGFDHQLTETVYSSFRIGRNLSHLEFKQTQLQLLPSNPPVISSVIVDAEENASGEIVQFLVEKEFSKANLIMQWDRRFSPSSQGARQEIEEVSGILRYQLTPLINLVGAVRFRKQVQEGTLNTISTNGLDVLSYGTRMLYRISPTLRAEVGYSFREQTRIGQIGIREAHRISVGLRYRPTEMRFW